tara:strand:+ start:781 stop:1131 length:351 start_codon:yes stop_codon:yes gene_type:complete
MFYRVRVRVELQKVLRENGMSGDPDDCYLTHHINVQGIRNHGTAAKRLNLSIRDAVFYCIEHTIEEFSSAYTFDEYLELDKPYVNYQKYPVIDSLTAETYLRRSINDEYAEKEKPW